MRVLFIEDNPDDAVYIEETLRDGGIEIDWAEGLSAGLNRLAEGAYDAVLLDLSLPESRGLDTFDKVNASSPALPIVVLSGLDNEAVAIQAVQRGAQDYLVKGQITRPLLGRALHYAVDRKRAETALRQSEEKYRTLAEGIKEILYRADPDTFTTTYVNRAVEAVYGCSAEEWLRDPGLWERAIHPEDKPRVLAALQEARRRLKDGALEYRILTRNNDTRVAEDHFFWETDAHGNPVSLTGIVYDITERKHLEQQFLQAQKMEAIGRLAGGVAHDFRNQLTVIKGFGEMLLRRSLVVENGRDKVEEILRAAERSTMLASDLLAFSRQQTMRPEVVNVDKLIAGMSGSLARMIGEDVRLAVIPSGNLANVKVDPGAFQQALMNIVVNARDAMPQGGWLTIETANVELDEAYVRQHIEASVGLHVMVAISDTGAGMDQQTLENIFEPFFTTKPVSQGTGLGLSMVYGFVKQSGGHVTAHSEPGQGTIFKMYFPKVTEAAPPPQEPADTAGLDRGMGTILVVEDEKAVRRFIVQVLEEFGYTVLEAAESRIGLSLAERHEGQIDVLITDVVMPDMNGPDLAACVGAIRTGIRVLYISGYTGRGFDQGGVVEKEANLLTKPFGAQPLIRAVQAALRSAKGPEPQDAPTDEKVTR